MESNKIRICFVVCLLIAFLVGIVSYFQLGGEKPYPYLSREWLGVDAVGKFHRMKKLEHELPIYEERTKEYSIRQGTGIYYILVSGAPLLRGPELRGEGFTVLGSELMEDWSTANRVQMEGGGPPTLFTLQVERACDIEVWCGSNGPTGFYCQYLIHIS